MIPQRSTAIAPAEGDALVFAGGRLDVAGVEAGAVGEPTGPHATTNETRISQRHTLQD